MSTTEHKPAKHAQEAQGHSVTTRLKEARERGHEEVKKVSFLTEVLYFCAKEH